MKSIIFDGTNVAKVGCAESGTSSASLAARTGGIVLERDAAGGS